MIGVAEEWSRNWREAFHTSLNRAASAGAVIYDRDVLYASRQRRSAMSGLSCRTTQESTVNTLNRETEL